MNALYQGLEGEILCAGCGADEDGPPLEPYSFRSHRPVSCPSCGFWIPVRLSLEGCRVLLTEARDSLVLAAEEPQAAAAELLDGRPDGDLWAPGLGDPLPRVHGARCRLQAMAALCTFYSGCFHGSDWGQVPRAIRKLEAIRSRWRRAARRRRRSILASACRLEEERVRRWTVSRMSLRHPTEAQGMLNLLEEVAARWPL